MADDTKKKKKKIERVDPKKAGEVQKGFLEAGGSNDPLVQKIMKLFGDKEEGKE